MSMVVSGSSSEPLLSEGLPFSGTASFLPSPSMNLFTSYINLNGLDWVESLKNLNISWPEKFLKYFSLVTLEESTLSIPLDTPIQVPFLVTLPLVLAQQTLLEPFVELSSMPLEALSPEREEIPSSPLPDSPESGYFLRFGSKTTGA